MVTSEEPQVWELYVHISFCELLAWQQCSERAEVWIQLRRSHHTLIHYHNPLGTLQESILKFCKRSPLYRIESFLCSDMIDFLGLTPLSAIFQLYHGDQF
jgi:hypothetical protein